MPIAKQMQASYERMGRYMLFTAPKALLDTKTTSDIMDDCGYPTCAYGQPYDYKDNGDTITFKCSSSSD